MRRLKRKNIKQFRQFKPPAFPASNFTAAPDFRQDDSYGAVTGSDFRQDDGYGVILPANWRIRQDDDSRAVIPDLIRNLCYCQKTVDPDFRQDDGYGAVTGSDFRQSLS